jgi:hypothetical protein
MWRLLNYAPPVNTDERMLEKRHETCHFVPLFGPSGAAFECRGWLGKPLLRHEIGPDVWAVGRYPDPVA